MSKSWRFNGSKQNEAVLKPVCEQVEQYFQLPPKRLFRYFAVTDDDFLADLLELGPHYRGFYMLRAFAWSLPDYLRNCFYHPPTGDVSFEDTIAFDAMIYIRASTCVDVTGCVATYAHELQHCVQESKWPRIFAANRALYANLGDVKPTATVIDIPYECDANIMSKRVAERVCGVDAVRRFAEQQVRLTEEAGPIEQLTRWVYFRDVPSSTEYNLVEETDKAVQKYKKHIEFGMNVDLPQWWLVPMEDDED